MSRHLQIVAETVAVRPRGRVPLAQSQFDDELLELQCSADFQVTNTRELLYYMDKADDDGRIDAHEWQTIFRYVRKEHQANCNSNAGWRRVRDWANDFFTWATSVRAQMQNDSRKELIEGVERVAQMKGAALADGPRETCI